MLTPSWFNRCVNALILEAFTNDELNKRREIMSRHPLKAASISNCEKAEYYVALHIKGIH